MKDCPFKPNMNLFMEILTYVVIGLSTLGAIRACVGIYRHFFGKTITCRATLLDKYETRYQWAGPTGGSIRTQYVLTFDLEGKIRKFEVSAWLYDSVQKGASCRVTYRDSRLISIG